MPTNQTDQWLARGLCGGVLLVFLANCYIRYREWRSDQPDYLSPEARERALRIASSQMGCYGMED